MDAPVVRNDGSMQRPTIVHYLLFLLLAYLWGTAFLLIKISVETLPPVAAATGRIWVAGATLGLLAYLFRARIPRSPRLWAVFAVLALFGGALPFTLLAMAEQRLASMEAAVIMGIAPVLIPALARTLGARGSPWPYLGGGLLLGFAGFAVLAWPQDGFQLVSPLSDRLYLLAAVLCYALTVVLSRLVQGVSTEAMSFSIMLCSIVIMTIVTLITVDIGSLSPSAASIAAIIVLGVFSTALASYLYYFLMQRVGAAFVAPNIYLLPPIAIFAGAVFQDEVTTGRLVAATILILTGTAIANSGADQWRQFLGLSRKSETQGDGENSGQLDAK